MKYSKFLVSTLVAAAAMTAPAFADYTWQGGGTINDSLWGNEDSWSLSEGETWITNTDGNGNGPGTTSSNMWNPISVSNASGTISGFEGWTLRLTLTNTQLTVGTLKKFQSNSDGDSVVTLDSTSSLTIDSFGGGNDGQDVTLNNSGAFAMTYNKNQGGSGFILTLGESSTTTFNLNGYTGMAKSISGAGTVNISGSGTFSLSGATDFSGKINVASGATLDLSGGTLALAGEISNSGTLAISAGSATFSGEVSESGNLTIASGATATFGSTASFSSVNSSGTLVVGEGGSLSLTGAVVLSSAIQNSGTVKVSESTVFNLVGFDESESGIYTVISGNGTVSGWDTLTSSNLQIDGAALAGRQTADFSTAGAVTISGSAANLVWNGGETGTWDTSTANWTNNGSTDHFYNKDNVEFSTSGANITLGESISAGTVTVSENTTLTASSDNTFSSNALTVASGKTLTLGGSIENYSWSSATLESDSVMDLGSGGEAIGSSETPLVLAGTGTVKYAFSSSSGGGTGSGLYIADGFTGTVDWTGCLNWHTGTNAGGADATLRLSARTDHTDDALWGNAAITLTSKIELGTDYGINLSSAGLTLTGEFSAQGKTLTVTSSNSTNTLALAGAVNIGTLKIDGGIVQLGSAKSDSTALNIANAAVTGTLSFLHQDATLSGAFSFAEGSTLLLADASSDYMGNVAYSTSGTVSLKISGGVTLGGTMNYQSPYWKATEISGKITGTGGIDFNGAVDSWYGTNAYLILSNDENDFSGGITITRDTGVVRATSGGALGTGTVNISAASGILSYAGTVAADGSYDKIINEITGSGTVKIDSGSVSLSGEVSAFSGAVSVASGAKLAVAADGGDTVALNLSAASGISFASGAKLLIDLSGVDASSATADEIVLKLISSNNISFGDTALTAENISSVLTGDSYELTGLKSGWEFQNFGYSESMLFATITIPEPSAFGLLAGVGALALVASRRRRRSRAK